MDKKFCFIRELQNEDILSITQQGIYRCVIANVSSVVNRPFDDAFILLVYTQGSTILYEAIRYGAGHERAKGGRSTSEWFGWYYYADESDVFFKSGEVYSIPSTRISPGVITGAGTTIFFSLYLPKRISNLEVSVNCTSFYVRSSAGYVLYNVDLYDFNTTFTPDDNTINVSVKYPDNTSVFSNISNNNSNVCISGTFTISFS